MLVIVAIREKCGSKAQYDKFFPEVTQLNSMLFSPISPAMCWRLINWTH